MTLQVTTDSLISDVQEQFQHYFPDFKLEFFFSATEKHAPPLLRSFPFVRISELRVFYRKVTLNIRETMTISELERKFLRKFGLPARIYRKVGGYWQKTASFDQYTLCREPEPTSLYFIHARAGRITPDFLPI